MGLNTPRDNPVEVYQRAQIKPVVATILNEPDSAERVASASATTAMHEAADPEIVERVRLILEAEEIRQQAFMRALLGGLPGWVHSETWRQLSIAYGDLSGQEFTDEQILAFVARHEESLGPGSAPDSMVFLRAVNYLAHVRYAVSLGPEEGLEVLYGHHAAAGYASKAGAADGGRRGAETRRKDGNLDKRDDDIRKARARGATVADLKERFGISERQIRNVLKAAKTET